MTLPQALGAPSDDGACNLLQRFAALQCTADFDGRFLEVNPALELALGYGPGELTSSSFAALAHPGDQPAVTQLMAEFPYASTGLSFEFRCLRKDGSSCWMAWNVRAHMDPEILYCSARDLTASREHASVVAKLLAELERSNSDLAQFAYVASHDLSEPLRMVSSYVQLLADRYRGQLDDDADDFIAFAVDGASRMKVLIDDLLAYSRAGTGTLVPRQVDCSALVRSTLADLDRVIVESGATVVVDELPVINGDGGQLALVFRNLLSNALKFVAPDVRPVIRVSAARDADAWRFTVQDNGIGIAEMHRDRIFLMFKRLHGRSEYPGTGIGLALCLKIITRLGGRIWLDGDTERGSAFHFSLPDVGSVTDG
ncbi:ATP-binding protein [Mycobacterium sp. SA01]|uniref:PAS domain-containing sensor histidine kinase n=1 Tax=Mycobacterium sp. SA01 TaxID=3238820 RepID=UPI00351B37E5